MFPIVLHQFFSEQHSLNVCRPKWPVSGVESEMSLSCLIDDFSCSTIQGLSTYFLLHNAPNVFNRWQFRTAAPFYNSHTVVISAEYGPEDLVHPVLVLVSVSFYYKGFSRISESLSHTANWLKGWKVKEACLLTSSRCLIFVPAFWYMLLPSHLKWTDIFSLNNDIFQCKHWYDAAAVISVKHWLDTAL